MPALSLWLNLARSGGTILARCLGCMEGVALLSEVHPLGTRIISPADQACDWHGLIKPAERNRLRTARYDELIGVLDERARAKGLTLLLRDWSHLDFTGAPFTEPSFTSRSAQLLATRFEPRTFASVRHPLDQWVSQQRLDLLRAGVDLDIYLRGCRAFAEAVAPLGFVRYEDFTLDPDTHLRTMCDGLGVPFDASWRERFSMYEKVTGDEEGKAAVVREIRPARRREIDPDLRARFEANADYADACRLLGYEP